METSKRLIIRGKSVKHATHSLIVVALIALGFIVGRLSTTASWAASGTLDSPALPESTFSYTLEDIYNRLAAGTTGAQSAFAEPASGPTAGTGHTLNQIMAAAPAADNADGALPANVLAGKTYWGLNVADEGWGILTGTIQNRGAVVYTPGTSNQTVAAGYHDGSGYVAGDTDLATGNIRSGVVIFGVAGNPYVVNTSSGDATAGDILSGKKAWVDGSEVTGAYPPAPVPKTGQTTSYGNRDDGELEKGIAWPSPRFTGNGDGTVTDNLTGLIWLKNADCFGARTWTVALSDANDLAAGSCGLTDSSSAGDWRLPNIQELLSLMDYGRYPFSLPDGHPFTGVQLRYWSSTTYAGDTSTAWYVYLYDGSVISGDKADTTSKYVWPVRGGQ